MSAREHLITQGDHEWNQEVTRILDEHAEEIRSEVVDLILSGMHGRLMSDPLMAGLDHILGLINKRWPDV